MRLKITSLLFCFLFTNAFASSDAPKIAHIGSSHHDAVIRHITENKAVVFSKPGAKGLIAFQALENKEVDFVLIPSSPLYITPFKEPDLYKFEPLKKFRLIGAVAEMEAGFYLSPKYKSVSELKNKNGTILHASGGDEANQIIDSTFSGKEIEHVNYKGIGQQVIDVKNGIADVTYLPAGLIGNFGEKLTEYNRPIKIHLITRYDVSEEKIQDLKKLINSSIVLDRAKEFSKVTKTKFIPFKGN